jgi:hypothetical protein
LTIHTHKSQFFTLTSAPKQKQNRTFGLCVRVSPWVPLISTLMIAAGLPVWCVSFVCCCIGGGGGGGGGGGYHQSLFDRWQLQQCQDLDLNTQTTQHYTTHTNTPNKTNINTRVVFTRRALATTALIGDSLLGGRGVAVAQLSANVGWATGLGSIIVPSVVGLTLVASLLRTYQEAAALPTTKCSAFFLALCLPSASSFVSIWPSGGAMFCVFSVCMPFD